MFTGSLLKLLALISLIGRRWIRSFTFTLTLYNECYLLFNLPGFLFQKHRDLNLRSSVTSLEVSQRYELIWNKVPPSFIFRFFSMFRIYTPVCTRRNFFYQFYLKSVSSLSIFLFLVFLNIIFFSHPWFRFLIPWFIFTNKIYTGVVLSLMN